MPHPRSARKGGAVMNEEGPLTDQPHQNSHDQGIEHWMVAAPVGADQCGTDGKHATYSATAVAFFDLVFLSVALVAYTPRAYHPLHAPCTSTSAGLLALGFASAGESHDCLKVTRKLRVSHTSATVDLSEPLRLWSLRASAPDDSRHCSSALPVLPVILVRGWARREL